MANCNDTKKEVITVLNRRIILPFYIPVICLIASLLIFVSKDSYVYSRVKIVLFSIGIIIAIAVISIITVIIIQELF